jgi:hypothetical protein
MGIVALHAIPLQHDFVNALRLSWHDPVVARQADLPGILCQEFPVVGSMRVVAVGAVPCPNRSVNEGKFHFLLESDVAYQTYLSFRARLQLELIQGKGGRGRRERHYTEKYQGGLESQIHLLSSTSSFPRCGIHRRSAQQKAGERSP